VRFGSQTGAALARCPPSASVICGHWRSKPASLEGTRAAALRASVSSTDGRKPNRPARGGPARRRKLLRAVASPAATKSESPARVDPLLPDGEPVVDADLLADEAGKPSGVDDALRHADLPDVDLPARSRPRPVERTCKTPGDEARDERHC